MRSDIRQQLGKRFPASQVKRRRTADGHLFEYVEIQAVVDRLNDVLNCEWSFEVINHQSRNRGLTRRDTRAPWRAANPNGPCVGNRPTLATRA